VNNTGSADPPAIGGQSTPNQEHWRSEVDPSRKNLKKVSDFLAAIAAPSGMGRRLPDPIACRVQINVNAIALVCRIVPLFFCENIGQKVCVEDPTPFSRR
jgi:hypothetical protein